MTYSGKFIDRSPSLRPAGLVPTKKDENIEHCFVHEVIEDGTKPFICKTEPIDFKLPRPKTNIYKGFLTDVRECIQPEVEHGFYDMLTQEIRDTVYNSYWRKPLGRLSDHTPMLPEGMVPEEVCFGKPTQIVGTVGELVSPPKSYVDVMEESQLGRSMYKKTHNSFDPGEKIHRQYVEPFNQDLVWGKTTPCDPQGGCMKKVIAQDSDEKCIVSKILADHRKRNRAMVGKVLAPNNNIECVPKNHAFGKINKREIYGVGELLKECPLNMEKIDLYEQLSHINNLRQYIMKRNPSFPHRDFLESLHKYDQTNTGYLTLDKTYEVLNDFLIFPEKSLFESFLSHLNFLSKERTVAYGQMADLLNVNVIFPKMKKLQDVPNEFLNFETTNEIANKYHCSEYIGTEVIPVAGISSDPHKCLEYLVSPNIFTNYGLQAKDFFIRRSPEYLRTLVERTGYRMDDKKFQNVLHYVKDENGCVCVYNFLKVLKNQKNIYFPSEK